jgi:transcription elongation factor GreA
LEHEYITEEGLQKIKEELHELKFNIRPNISKKIATARELGDLKENAEYHAAREELSLIETKIKKLQDKISRVRVIDRNAIPDDKAYILSTVVLKNNDTGESVKYTLVSPSEADFKQNKISVTSPIGKALLGRSAGENIKVNVPAGILHYIVMEIKKS